MTHLPNDRQRRSDVVRDQLAAPSCDAALQALQAASRDAAKVMGVSNEMGTIEVGKTADLVLLDADPLKSISNTRKIDAVILRGQLFSKEDLAAMSH